MKEIPNCRICQLKCCGCSGYHTCLMRKGENGHSIEDCSLMASKYYLFEKYLDSQIMKLCKYQDDCKSSAEAWR